MSTSWPAYLVIFFGVVNLLRMASFLIGANIYGVVSLMRELKIKRRRFPLFSVVVPAHNEEAGIIPCLASIYKSRYPRDRLEVIVVVNASTDNTTALARGFKRENHLKNLKIIDSPVPGKAKALNLGIKKYAHGSLVMCLDSDSLLDALSLFNAAKYFRDRRVAALSANVKIIRKGGLLNLTQQFEYFICYQMKRAQTVFNIEYIIGGIGSVFRKSILEKVGYYDTNTVTEDIDLTMKVLSHGNKKYRAVYGADVVAYTQSVLSVKDLIKQRYRWKWGRSQTFYKYRKMFFNPQKKFGKLLTFFYLPYAIFCDLAFFLEPLLVGYIFFVIWWYRDLVTLLSAFAVIVAYLSLNILAEDTISNKDKIKLVALTPLMYFTFYLLSFVEYVALIKALLNLRGLKKSLGQGCHWTHVERFKEVPV